MKLPKQLLEKKLKEELINNVKKGNLEAIKQNVINGVDLHDNQDNAFRLSAKYGHIELIKYLIEQGANITVKNNEAIKNAAKSGHLNIIEHLIEKGIDLNSISKEILYEAVKDKSSFPVVKYIIENGIHLNEADHAILQNAISNNNIKTTHYLIENGMKVKWIDSISIYLKANIKNKWIEMMRLLVESGADIQNKDNEVFKFTCANDSLEIAQYLFEKYEDKSIPINIIEKYKPQNINEWLKKYLTAKQLSEQLETELDNKKEIKATKRKM